MAEFYVTNESIGEAGNVIHSTTCESLPDTETLRYLGSFATSDAAFNKAKGFCYQVSNCPVCLQS